MKNAVPAFVGVGDTNARAEPQWHPTWCRIKSYPAHWATDVRSTQQFSITLPNELAELVRAKVQSGEYATDSEVIRDGLRTLAARDRVVESWLRDEVGPAFDALNADPSRALTVDQVRAALVAKRKGGLKTG